MSNLFAYNQYKQLKIKTYRKMIIFCIIFKSSVGKWISTIEFELENLTIPFFDQKRTLHPI